MGCSRSTTLSVAAGGGGSVEGRVLQARDDIFEEELFYEIVREARVLGSQGVTTQQNLVRLPIMDEKDVMLDFVDYSSDGEWEDKGPDLRHGEGDDLAEGLSHLIHILLSYSHRQNLRRRTQIPPPLMPRKRHVPEYQLLRPVMAYLQHSSRVQWLQSFLTDLFKSTGGYSVAPFSSAREENLWSPRVESLVEQLILQPLESTVTCDLTSRFKPDTAAAASFELKIHTSLSGPPFGTRYDFSVSVPSRYNVRPFLRVASKEDASAVITHLAELEQQSTPGRKDPTRPRQ